MFVCMYVCIYVLTYVHMVCTHVCMCITDWIRVIHTCVRIYLMCTALQFCNSCYVRTYSPPPHQYLDESGRPLSVVSQYSFVSQISDDRSSVYSQGPPPGPLPDALSQSSGSRPTSMIAVEKRSPPRSTPEDLGRPVSLPPAPSAISGPHQPSIVAEDIIWYCIEDYRDHEAGFSLSVGEAVEVLDTFGPQWYVSTIKEPQEGFVPPDVLSQVRMASQAGSITGVYVYIRMYVRISVDLCTYMYVYVCVCVCVYL